MERAFDLTRYQEISSFNLRALENDTPALAVEGSSNRPVEKRVWRAVEALWKGRVVQRKTSKEKDVLSFYSDKTESQRKEKEAGRKMKQFLLEKPDGFIFVWLSPPGEDYQEGRIRIGVKKTKLEIPVVESFGIPIEKTNPEDCLFQFYCLEEYSEEFGLSICVPEDIRSQILTFDTHGQGLSFLRDKIKKSIVPDSIWEAIQTGQVARENARVARLAKTIVASQKRELEEAIKSGDKRQLITIGAKIEQELINLGFNIQKGTCGLLNGDFLNILNNPLTLNSLSYGMVSKEKWSYEPGRCRKPPGGCGVYKKEVGPCGICKDCEKKYN